MTLVPGVERRRNQPGDVMSPKVRERVARLERHIRRAWFINKRNGGNRKDFRALTRDAREEVRRLKKEASS